MTKTYKCIKHCEINTLKFIMCKNNQTRRERSRNIHIIVIIIYTYYNIKYTYGNKILKQNSNKIFFTLSFMFHIIYFAKKCLKLNQNNTCNILSSIRCVRFETSCWTRRKKLNGEQMTKWDIKRTICLFVHAKKKK